MARNEVSVSRIILAGLADPAGTAGNAGGHKFQNDGLVALRVVNAASNTNAVLTLAAGSGTAASGNYAFSFQVAGRTYTTASLAFGILKAAIASAALAATRVSGSGTVALSADYPTGVITGGGTDLPTGPATLTFSVGLGNMPVTNPAIVSQPGGGTYEILVTTPGTGTGTIQAQIPYTPGGVAIPSRTLSVPVGTSWFGPFTPQFFDQPAGSTDPNEVYVDYDVAANYTVTPFHLG